MTTLAKEKPADAILHIEALAKGYAQERLILGGFVEDLKIAQAQLLKRHLTNIRKAAANAATEKALLVNAIAERSDLFVKPRTMTLHGIKLGMKKGVGSIDWDDDEKLSAKIEKLHPEQYDVLVKTTRKPQAKALTALSVSELRKLGCEVEETGDHVYIKAADSAIDKLVAALLEEGSQTEEGAS